jgi:hypothetical protein
MKGHLPVVRVLAESWPLDRRPWKMFLMGGGAASELQDFLSPPANRTTRNFLPLLYSKPDMVKEIWKYLHKPRYVDPDQTNDAGDTAAHLAARKGHADIVELLQGLGVDAGVVFAAGDGGGDTDSDSGSTETDGPDLTDMFGGLSDGDSSEEEASLDTEENTASPEGGGAAGGFLGQVEAEAVSDSDSDSD